MTDTMAQSSSSTQGDLVTFSPLNLRNEREKIAINSLMMLSTTQTRRKFETEDMEGKTNDSTTKDTSMGSEAGDRGSTCSECETIDSEYMPCKEGETFDVKPFYTKSTVEVPVARLVPTYLAEG
jgi:hypothetical protein